jgi:type I restriction enzyme S subunit
MSSKVWKTYKLGDIAQINMGQSPESKYYNNHKEGFPFLQGNRTFRFKYPSIDTYCSAGNKFAEKDDILISVRAPVGDLNIAQTKLCIGRGLASLKMNNGNNEYLYFLLKSNIQNLISE